MAAATLHKPDPRQATIDRFGELDWKVQQLAPALSEHKALKAEIEGWFANHPANQPATIKGKKYTAQLSMRKLERTITNPGKAFTMLKKAVGSFEEAVKLVNIPLGAAVDAFIPASQHKSIIKEAHTGSRTLKCVRNDG